MIRPTWKLQFAMGTLMMIVLSSASASALFAKIWQLTSRAAGATTIAIDVPILVLLATALTTVALASWKGHSLALAMLQMTLACLGWLVLIWLMEAGYERALRYWFEAGFGIAVALPLLVRRAVKSSLPRGPRRDWWKNACEAVSFSGLNMLLVLAGLFFHFLVYWGASALVPTPAAAPPAQKSVGVGTPTPNGPTTGVPAP